MASSQQVVVIGIDGVSYRRLRRYAEEGKLPTIERLMREGASGVLRSTIFPTSPVAWSCSFTGQNPAKTRMYGFYTKDPKAYAWNLVSAYDRVGKDVWELASEQGRRSIVVGFPFTLPKRPFNGILVSGNFTPDLAKGVYPPELTEFVLKDLGYSICSHRAFPEEICDSIANRFAVGRALMAQHTWDLFMLGFEQTEIVHHFMMMSDPQAMEKCYQVFDDELGRFLDHLPVGATLLLYSDHGNDYYPKAFHLTSWLVNEGYLAIKKGEDIKKVRREKLRHDLDALRAKNVSWPRYVGMASLYLSGIFARRHLRFIKSLFPGLSMPADARPPNFGFREGRLISHFYDYGVTRAYPAISTAGNYGGLYLNVVGRDPKGIVKPGDEYEKLREEIADRLLRVQDPRTGEAVVQRVWKKEELFHGPYLHELADLFIEASKSYHILSTDQWIDARIVKPWHESSHEIEGTVIACGPGIKTNSTLSSDIINIAPTILYLLGCSVPSDLDGLVIDELFETPLDVTYQEIPAAGPSMGDEGGFTYSDEERRAIEKRLMELGYLE